MAEVIVTICANAYSLGPGAQNKYVPFDANGPRKTVRLLPDLFSS